MQAIMVHALGDPDVMTLGTRPTPEPGPGEVLVRVRAAGVNFSDTERRRGIYDPPALPWIPGNEAAGVVEAVGPNVTGVKPGDHAVLSFRPACGSCRLCALGRSVLCEGYAGDRFKMHDGTAG
jgi:Zn-dependent alcohol dehydrogenase